MRRNPFRTNLFWLLPGLLIALLLALPVALQADQAQYFYDELGRLAVVVDADKNVAVYNYGGKKGDTLLFRGFSRSAFGP